MSGDASIASSRAAEIGPGSTAIEAKMGALLERARLAPELGNLFIAAERLKLSGDYAAAHAAYQTYLAHSRADLKATLDFNARFPESPFTVPEIARPLVNALMVDADIVQALGDRAAAELLRQEALDVSRTHLGRRGTAESERSRAASLTLEGRFNEAIVALQGARDVTLEAGDAIGSARIAIDLADVLHWLGDLARAKEEIDHAASIIEPMVGERGITQKDILAGVATSVASIMAGKGDLGDATRAAGLYRAFTEVAYYRGLIAKSLAQWDEAERHFELVLPEYQALGSGEAIEYQFAQISLGRGEYAKALGQSRRIAPVFERGAFRPKRGVLQKLQAECLHALGDSDAALPLIGESIQDLTQRHFDPDALWRSQRLRARIHGDKNDRAQALQSWRDAIATISELRRAPLGYRLDSTYLADKKGLYTEAISAAVRAGEAADCCRFIESIKSRTLTAVLSLPRSQSESSAGFEEQFDTITRQLDVVEYQAYREGWTDERKSRRSALLKQRGDLLERIRIADPRWRALSQSRPLDLDAVLKVLWSRSQAALTLYYEPPDLTAVLLFGGDVRVCQTKVTERLSTNLSEYANNLRKLKPDFYKYDLWGEYRVAADDLVPASLLEQALTARSLVVIPHGPLHLVPWAGLVHEGKRLFEHLPVAILPNLAAAVADIPCSRPRTATLLGVARYPGFEKLGDLPSAPGEMTDIGGLYGDAGIVVHGPLLDEDATEVAFWDVGKHVAGSGNLLHISCHGIIVPSEPMNSGLLLFDAKVDAAEVARAPLPFDEVVLSACSTGWRPTEVGDIALTADEILGIPAGFLEAGVKSVLVSIPQAEGRAARALTTHYHRRRAAGDAPLLALQAAQKQMLESGIPPCLWVGFALYGCA
jgi:CHAT domain-containing protein/tetratricopeptide (TPR) repeat protein